MFDAGFYFLYSLGTRHRRSLLAVILLVFVFSLWRLSHLNLDDNIEKLLPADEAVLDAFRFLRQSGFSDQVILSLSLPDPEADPGRLVAAVDRLAAALPGPLISEVRSGVPNIDLTAEWAGFLPLVPQMVAPAGLEELRRELTPEEIDRRIGAIYRRLLAPGTSMASLQTSDPLGIAGGVLEEIRKLTAAFGYRVKAVGGHLLSEDERHALLILKTPVLIPDGSGSRALLGHLEDALAASPEPLQADIVAGHRHTVSNETVIRRDVQRTVLAAAAGFLLLFLVVFRDWRGVVIFLIPIGAIVISIALSSLIFPTLSHFILGMSVVLAGIAMDYAIHVYVARRRAGAAGPALVARPIFVGAFTTGAVFAAFFFSSVPGYWQLAVFSIISLVICLAASFLFLPQLVRTEIGRGGEGGWGTAGRARSRRDQWIVVGTWLAGLGLLGLSATGLVFQRDIEQFDGSDKEVLRTEREFHRVWGGENRPAMLVVEGDDQETVWRKYEEVSKLASGKMGGDNLMTLARIWPSRETRERRLNEWRIFWDERGPAIREALAGAGKKYGFTADAFRSFFSWVNGEDAGDGLPAVGFIGQLRERFVIFSPGRTWAIAFFEDTEENLRRLEDLEESRGHPDVRLISRRAISRHISRAISREIGGLAAIAGALILIPVFLLLRNLRRGLLALTPMVTALVSLLGFLPLIGLPFSAASLVAAMIVVGLVIDYGVYVVFNEQRQLQVNAVLSARLSEVTGLAIHLSAGTTLIGAGALLLARHPVMFAIGLTLVIGVTTGYLSALWVVPALYRLTDRRTLP